MSGLTNIYLNNIKTGKHFIEKAKECTDPKVLRKWNPAYLMRVNVNGTLEPGHCSLKYWPSSLIVPVQGRWSV